MAAPQLASSDADPQETREWLDALEAVIAQEGPERAHFLLEQLIALGHQTGINMPYSANTEYTNTIPADQQPVTPGDYEMEQKIRDYARWNALVMVLRANKDDSGLGGHIASYASAATLYDIGFNHFWHAPSDTHGGDLVLSQGHSAPGTYARAFMLGRLSEEQMDNFRREVDGKGLSSYPHPWLMPDFWQFPTVSMGLGPLQAIYQARFMKYMQHREMIPTDNRKVWAFMGDGEMDEPESMGAIGMAGREKLDNLIFVINCNLQRLDGPVRGNGKIIQELESDFRGAGWNVIKVIWGSYWDPLLAQDKSGLLRQRMMECVDGDYQTFKARDGAYVREHFFGKYPELAKLVSTWSDDDIWRLNRGGHDPHKVYAAYAAAVAHTGQPTVILAKTIKGYGMGEAGEAMNITHQQKKMGTTSVKAFRDRFKLPIKDEDLEKLPYLTFPEGSKELNYMRERRMALGGYSPARRRKAESLPVPPLSAFDALLKAGGEGRQFSTTMSFVRGLNVMLKDKIIGKRVVPIVVDESRTFGMEGLFRQIGIWNQDGQNYVPQDADQMMFYKEKKDGQILQEGINEAGAMADWIAAGTSYSTHGVQMIPVYVCYSMFGMQRTMDLVWAAGDQRARGFLVGGTAGRTTLNGEGLQHEDGHSLHLAAAYPNCVAYDPAFAYELATIIRDGCKRMFVDGEDVFYYLTVYNENYVMPAMPEGIEDELLGGLYKFADAPAGPSKRATVLFSGPAWQWAAKASDELAEHYDVGVELWSATSYKNLRDEALAAERWNRLHPSQPSRTPWVTQQLDKADGPFVAVSDFMTSVPDMISRWVPGTWLPLGTDGFGRSDTRDQLRRHFEVDHGHVVVAVLTALAKEQQVKPELVADAIARYGIDPEASNPATS